MPMGHEYTYVYMILVDFYDALEKNIKNIKTFCNSGTSFKDCSEFIRILNNETESCASKNSRFKGDKGIRLYKFMWIISIGTNHY